MENPEDVRARVRQGAERLAARLQNAADASVDDDEVDALTNGIRDLGPEFAFDREGRPGAIAAVREALPVVERELFDAIVEDHACEVAAFREAVRQLMDAMRRR
jgi:hypothetical protein